LPSVAVLAAAKDGADPAAELADAASGRTAASPRRSAAHAPACASGALVEISSRLLSSASAEEHPALPSPLQGLGVSDS